jgi:hypothetical protein
VGQRRARRSWRKEHASLAALEGVFVGMFLVTSIAIVVTLEDKPPAKTETRSQLEEMLNDILVGLEALPTSDRFMTQVERAVGKAVLGNTTDLDRLLDRTLPEGTACRFWIDNGKERRLLVGTEDDGARETVGASRLYHPTWAYAVVVPSLDLVSSTQPLDVQGFGVSQGALIKEAGVPVKAIVTTTLGSYHKESITSIRGDSAASLYMKDSTGTPTFIVRNLLGGTGTQSSPAYNDTGNSSLHNGNFTINHTGGVLSIAGSFTGDVISYLITLTAPNGTPYPYTVTGAGTASLSQVVSSAQGVWTVTATGSITGLITPKKANLTISQVTDGILNFTFGVRESGGVALPVGTKLTVRLPYLFESIDATNTTQSGWKSIAAGKSTQDGTIVTALFDSTLASGERTFVVRAKPPASADVLYNIQAELSDGASARANFVVSTLGAVVSPDNTIQRDGYLTVPKPLAAGKVSTFGLVFPAAATSLAGLPESITQVDLQSADGTPLFSAVQGVYPTNGWSVVSKDHLRWSGTTLLLSNAVTEWVANVTADTNLTASEPGADLPIEFGNGAHYSLMQQSSPYVFQGSFEPGSAGRGYAVPSFSAGGKGNATLGVEWYARALRVAGNATYTVSAAGDLPALGEATRLGLARSHLDFSATKAKIGEQVQISPDFSGLLSGVSAYVNTTSGRVVMADWSVEVKVLDPLQPFNSRDQWQALASTETSLAKAQLNYTASRGDFYGPHPVLAEAHFSVEDVVTGNVTVQTARLLGVLDVIPDGGQSETALYWISLECWLPDWV